VHWGTPVVVFRTVLIESMNEMLKQLQETKVNVSDESKRGSVWGQMTKDSVTNLEALANHLRFKLLCAPMTPRRRKQLENVSFQNPFQADKALLSGSIFSLMDGSENLRSLTDFSASVSSEPQSKT